MNSIHLIVPLEGGEEARLVAEVDPVDAGSVQLVADRDGKGKIAQAAISLSESFDNLQPAMAMIVSKLKSAASQPDEIKIDFGLKIGGETGLIFAKGTAEANLTVSVTWKRQP